MSNQRRANQILWLECFGFAAIIAISWLDELAQLPHRIFGGNQRSDWREAALESLVTLMIWLVVFVATKRILRRFYELERLLKMCAWCRRLEHGGKSVSLEDYLQQELGVETSHGICASCGRNLLEEAQAEQVSKS